MKKSYHLYERKYLRSGNGRPIKLDELKGIFEKEKQALDFMNKLDKKEDDVFAIETVYVSK